MKRTLCSLVIIGICLCAMSFTAWAQGCTTATYLADGVHYTTIQSAIAAVGTACGVVNNFAGIQTIKISAGTYAEYVNTNLSIKPTATYPLVIQAASGTVIINGAGNANGMRIAVPHVRLINITIQNATTYDLFGDSADDLQASGMTLTGASSASGMGFMCLTCTNSSITNSTVYNNGTTGGVGIDFNGGSGNSVIGPMTVHDNNACVFFTNSTGGSITGSSASPTILYNCGTGTGGGATFTNGANNGTVSGLVAYNNRYNLNVSMSTTGVSITNSLSVGGQYGWNCDTTSQITATNTIIYGATTAAVQVGANCTVALKNNIIWETVSTLYDISVATTATATTTSDYNVFYTTNGARVGYWGTTECDTLSTPTTGWQAVTSQDAHSYFGDPKFVNAGDTSAVSYKWSSSSPAKDHGTATGAPSTDYFGATRPKGTAYDIGFYEMIPSGSSLLLLNSGRHGGAGKIKEIK